MSRLRSSSSSRGFKNRPANSILYVWEFVGSLTTRRVSVVLPRYYELLGIAYSDSPTASRASAFAWNSSQRMSRPRWNVHVCAQ